MPLILANVSFGIYALMPHGWAFMAAIVILEITLVSRLLAGAWWKKELVWPLALANAVSGGIGFAVSLLLNGGWWLVLWIPWVSPHEVNLEKHLMMISTYYACAFLVSVVTEGIVEHLMLRRRFEKKRIWLACVASNVASYAIGSVFLYSWSFGVWG